MGKSFFADLLPPLSTAEFEALKADIKANGVRVPIFEDEDGNVLDGHHRLKIDKDAPRKTIKGLSLAEKQAFVFQCNFTRRNLSSEQKRDALKKMKAVAKALREEDAKKNTQARVAAVLGVSRSCVEEWFRVKNKEQGHNDKSVIMSTPDARVKIPKAAKPVILKQVAETSIIQVAADYGVSEKTIDRIVATEKKKAEVETQQIAQAKAAEEAGIKTALHVCSMADLLGKTTWLDAIITDPPYPKEYLPLYGELACLASKALKPNGILAVMCGQSYLPEILPAMAAHMPYRWMLAYLTPGGQSAQIWKGQVNTFWKPILLFGGKPENWIGDVVKSDMNDNDKQHHHWGQSESGIARLVESLTTEGQLICDPFLGAGTTGVVCVRLKRQFIGCDISANCVAKAKTRILAEASR